MTGITADGQENACRHVRLNNHRERCPAGHRSLNSVRLLTKTQTGNQIMISVDVATLQIVKQAATLADKFQQSPS